MHVILLLCLDMAAAIANLMLNQSDKPWLVQVKALEIITAGNPFITVAIGVGGGLLIALIGWWLVPRKDVI